MFPNVSKEWLALAAAGGVLLLLWSSQETSTELNANIRKMIERDYQELQKRKDELNALRKAAAQPGEQPNLVKQIDQIAAEVTEFEKHVREATKKRDDAEGAKKSGGELVVSIVGPLVQMATNIKTLTT